MLRQGRAVYQDIVEENQCTFPEQWFQGSIHGSLKRRRSTRETKVHRRDSDLPSELDFGYFGKVWLQALLSHVDEPIVSVKIDFL
jgi:hypothetical protein